MHRFVRQGEENEDFGRHCCLLYGSCQVTSQVKARFCFCVLLSRSSGLSVGYCNYILKRLRVSNYVYHLLCETDTHFGEMRHVFLL